MRDGGSWSADVSWRPWPTRSPSPAGRRRWTSSTWRACARPRSWRSTTIRPGRPRTGRRSATCRCASGSPSSTASASTRCSSPTARCRRTRSCSSCSSTPATPVVVESPTYDRTLLNLRNRGADIRMVPLETDGIDVDELELLLRDEGVRPTLAHVIPNFQNPAGYTLSAAQAGEAARARRASSTSRCSRTTRTSRSASRARACRRCSRRTTRARSSTPRRSPRPSAPASASATWSARPAVIKQIQGDRHQHLHLAEHGRRSRSSTSSCARAGWTARSRPSRTRCASGATRWWRRCERELPEARVLPARGRLLHVGRPAGGDQRRRARDGGVRARRDLRQGHRLPARGRREHAPARLLRRDARADRRGDLAAGRGRARRLASRHSYGEHPSQFCELHAGGDGRRRAGPRRASGARATGSSSSASSPPTSWRAAGRCGTSSTGGSATAAAGRQTVRRRRRGDHGAAGGRRAGRRDRPFGRRAPRRAGRRPTRRSTPSSRRPARSTCTSCGGAGRPTTWSAAPRRHA